MAQHWILLLRLGQFINQVSHVATLFICRNQRFFSVATHITLWQQIYIISVSRQRSFSEALLLSQQDFPCCNLQCRDKKSLVLTEVLLSACFICCDMSFFVSTDTLSFVVIELLCQYLYLCVAKEETLL